MGCKGVCWRYKTSRGGAAFYYSEDDPNRKFCSVCDCKISWPFINCPCCNFRLRTKPRNSKIHARIKVALKIKDMLIEMEPIIEHPVIMVIAR